MANFEKTKKKKYDEHLLRHIIRQSHFPDRRRLLDGDIVHLAELIEARPSPLVMDNLSDVLALTIHPRPIC